MNNIKKTGETYNILFVGALSQELNPIKEEIKKLGLINFKTSFLTTGMGNYNMILNLSRFLEQKNEFDFVINIGVCGYTEPLPTSPCQGRSSSVIQVARVFNLSNSKELIIPNLFDFGTISSIASSEKPIYDSDELEGENYVDMESYGFEKVCDSFSIPRIILKIPVDKVGKETKNFDFKKSTELLKNNIDYKELFDKIQTYLESTFSTQRKVNEKSGLEKYKEHFGFTFSENEIFKRFYYRFNALANRDFDLYFENNKMLNKKEFLEELRVYLNGFLVK